MPTNQVFDNAFKAEWELFLRHVVLDEPFPWDLLAGARGVQLAEAGIESWHKRVVGGPDGLASLGGAA